MIETEIKITPEIAAEHGLTADEFARVQQILGRDPSLTELGIFSVMWSEHCSYKSSKVHLKRLPTRGTRVVQGPGENAGVVDIGDGWCAVFKIESHNHPSFVEPFQGAATGVGGILRDIFTMGARPIAVMDSLRFGEIVPFAPVAAGFSPSSVEQGAGLKAAATETAGEVADVTRNRRILDGVIRGIAHYGNCFGVPTVGGEILFEPCYAGNPLVNALALGIARREELFFARARGAGNPVIYVGAKTGRDGIHGASLLASAEFTEESQQKRPNVQVGDPFLEKLLLEACLEAMLTGAVVGIQDMGAAGLTCSTCEMASRGGTGIEIELDRVPQRETGMTPYEIMLSESQERMLLVAERGREAEVLGVFAKWGLDAVEIGTVTDDGLLRVRHHAAIVAEIPAHPLAEEGPVYHRPVAPEPARTAGVSPASSVAGAGAGVSPASAISNFEFRVSIAKEQMTEALKALLASPAIASKRWVFEQYDHMVRTNTLVAPGAGDAAVVRVKGTGKPGHERALALSTDCNGRWCALDAKLGAMHAVAEAARNVACSGARPVAATNCLNFGSPEKPEVMRQFSDAIDGIAEACRALDTPITGGNVSFYNETLGRGIFPTPTIGILGVLDDAARALGMGFRAAGDVIVLLDGKEADSQPEADSQQSTANSSDSSAVGCELSAVDFFSSEYAKRILGIVGGTPPPIDLAAERRLIDALVAMAAAGVLHSAHDVSDGGLAVAIAESCFASCTAGILPASFVSDAGTNVAASFSSPSAHAADQAPPQEGGVKPPHSKDAGKMPAVQLGADVALESDAPAEYALFHERGARAVVSCAPDALARVQSLARQYDVNAQVLGNVGGSVLRVRLNGRETIAADIASLKGIWATSLRSALAAR